MRVILIAAILVHGGACLTPRPPVGSPALLAGGPAVAKESVPDAAQANPPARPPGRCTETLGEAEESAYVVAAGKDETAIDKKRWIFAAFFNRVKARVGEHWHPAKEYDENALGKTAAHGRLRITRVHVRLRADGWLDKVTVHCSSGLVFLDNLAVQAFEKAQPFLNPPQEVVGDSGLITFVFGFRFDTETSAATTGTVEQSQ